LAHAEEAMQVRAHVVATLTAALGSRQRRPAAAPPVATAAVTRAAEELS
jgi:hypothetical protein